MKVNSEQYWKYDHIRNQYHLDIKKAGLKHPILPE